MRGRFLISNWGEIAHVTAFPGRAHARKGRKGRKGREGRTGAPTKSGRVRGEDGRGRQGLRGG
jgi:hypothetical protein